MRDICKYQIHSIGCSFFILFGSAQSFFLGKDWAEFNCNQLEEQTGITELCTLIFSLYPAYLLVRTRI